MIHLQILPEAESLMAHVTILNRKRKAEPSTWKKNCANRLRNSGKSYKTLAKEKEIPERKLQPACNEKCKQNCSSKFTEEERLKIFKNYWDIRYRKATHVPIDSHARV